MSGDKVVGVAHVGWPHADDIDDLPLGGDGQQRTAMAVR